MKVLVVTNMYPTKEKPSYGSFIKTQVDSLIKKGVDIEIFFIRGDKSKVNYIYAIFSILWRCFTRDYDIVHAHYGLSGLAARVQRRVPLIVSFCGDDLYGHADEHGNATRTSLFWVWCHKQLSKHVSGVIVKSEVMKELQCNQEAEVIPNGIDFDVFRPLNKKKYRKMLGLSDNKKYVLFPYNPKRIRKNYKAVEKAVEILNNDESIKAEILVVQGLANEELPYYMNAADVMVLASFWEGSPNAIKEAMSCNLPIVSSDVGDVRELIGKLEGCAICKPEPEEIAKNLNSIMKRKEKFNGRDAAINLKIEKIADRVISEYKKYSPVSTVNKNTY